MAISVYVQDRQVNVSVGGQKVDGGAKNAVLYTPQILTEEQKSQARENIGATDEYINGLISAALGVIENGTY